VRRPLLTLLLCLAGTVAGAAELAVSPLRVDLDPQHPIGVLTVTNQGSEPAVIQAGVQRWQQTADDDLFEPADGLLITPALFRLKPGQHQLIRIGWRQPVPRPLQAAAWRIFLSEVPAMPAPGASGLRMSLRLSIPLFMYWPDMPPADLRWQWLPASGSQPGRLQVSNLGGRHARVTRLLVDGETAPRAQLLYVLPGATRQLPLPDRTGAVTRITVTSDDGSSSQAVPAAAP